VLKPFAGRDLTLHAVRVPGHACHAPADLVRIAKANGLAAMNAENVPAALAWIGRHADRAAPPVVLIMGSLYLAGEVLKANGQLPA
jgi:dihydrofolate synthase/folylpolyglutamate synthase